MMVVECKFNLEQVVYLKHDPEQLPRMVTGLMIRPFGILYHVSIGTQESSHYECEIADEVDIVTKMK